MSKIYWILLAVICWLVFVIVQIPASWGGYMMTRNGALALTGISGTVWHGRASMASISIDGRDYSLGELSWNLHPMSLLKLSPCADISTNLERQQVSGTACAGLNNKLTLSNADISVPASLVQGLPDNIEIAGQVSAHIKSLELKQQTLLALAGNISWSAARLNNGQRWLNLGAFAAELSATDSGAILAEVFSLEGPIDLKGNVTMPLAGGVIIDVDFTLSDSFSTDVQANQWLPMIATPLDNGRQQIQMQL
ncbi:type II secretion system protein N [Gilvimarinus polysaccharolyticus]|uniref:type II secretion system protein N n=1 Tax=Gilvimarinus polysaccharolyticus TaxID=863921 RepID=UPI0006738499|nr:type II secretion system protein N [Gilvimarinus polysaccharolyticus]